ncbi:MAG: hypothetical protein J6O41_02140 [Clostridia bacterium]|nr:hypothetical protein [Clostridia bacterium]
MPIINLVGQRFGRLTVLNRAEKPENSKSTSAFWLCRCDCGTEKIISGNVLRQGKAKSCGCYNRDSHKYTTVDLTGKQFGDLTVLCRADKPENLKSKGAYWLCKCSCGKEKVMYGRTLLGGAKSCGGCRSNIVDDLTGQRFWKLTVIERDFSRPSNGNGVFWKCKCDCGNIITALGKNLKFGSVKSCGCLQSTGESEIQKILDQNNVKYKTQYTFPDLYGDGGGHLRFDFGLLDDNGQLIRLIEFQGEQHYPDQMKSNNFMDNPVTHDQYKQQYCLKNNIKLVLIPYWERHHITLEDILGDEYLYKITERKGELK